MKNEKTLQDRVQFIIAMISFVGTVFLFIFLLGKDVQSSDSKSDFSAEKVAKIDKEIESLSDEFIKTNNEILSTKIDTLLNKQNIEEVKKELKEYRNLLSEVKDNVGEINKNQELYFILFNKFINEEWKEMKLDFKEYIKREK